MFSEKKIDYLHFFLILTPALFFLFNAAKLPADDGFFYPQIAYNIVHGKGSYFNDLYLTNGYHPLWMLFCVFAELLNPFGKQNVIYILWAIQFFLFFFGFWLVRNLFTNKNIRFSVLMILGIGFLGIGTLYLTEAHLNFFTICLLLHFLIYKKNDDFLFGFIASLLFLARLDNIFLILTLGIYYWSRRKWSFISLIKILISFSILTIPYIISNIIFFDSIVPISGRIKSTFPHIKHNIRLGIWQEFFLISTIIYYIILLINKNVQYKILKIHFVTGSFVIMLYNIIFQYDVMQWYFVSQLLALGLMIYDILITIKVNIPYYIKIFGNGLLVLISITIPAIKTTGNFSFEKFFILGDHKLSFYKEDPVKSTAEKISNLTSDKARIFIYDIPGRCAFYSDSNYIPADGLVGNDKYLTQISSSPFTLYMKLNNIDYLILPSNFNSEKNKFSYLGLEIHNYKNLIRYFIKNPKTSNIVSEVNLKDFELIATFDNPVKFHQNFYENINLYKLIKENRLLLII